MAIGSLGELAMRLISLPVDLASTVTTSLGNSIVDRHRRSRPHAEQHRPACRRAIRAKVLDSRPIEVPHHTIIGDRGKGDSPHSSDGVVEYWSSHLKTAESEKIVPGPHGACEMPETLAELRRMLHLHLDQTQPHQR